MTPSRKRYYNRLLANRFIKAPRNLRCPLSSDEDIKKKRPYLMDRLAIGLGNKHLDEGAGIDTMGSLGLAEVSSLGSRAAKIRGLSDLWAAAPKFQDGSRARD